MIKIFNRLAFRSLLRGMLFGVRPRREAVARAVLHFMQQALNQVPVVSRHPDSTSGVRSIDARAIERALQVVTGTPGHRSAGRLQTTDRRHVEIHASQTTRLCKSPPRPTQEKTT
ncbi:hypothetical protein D3C79_867990 [compost metagenome]